MKKRIVIWTASYRPVLGGLQTITESLAEGLKDRGNRVVILTNRVPSSLPKYELINNIPVYRYRFYHPMGSVSSIKQLLISVYGFFIYPFRLVQLCLLLRSIKPHIINIHFPGQQLWYSHLLFRMFRHIEWITSLHGDEILQFFESRDGIIEPSLKSNPGLSERIRMHLLISWIIRSGRITACSSYLMKMVKIIVRNKLFNGFVIYNGIDFGRFEKKSAAKPRAKYFFAYGRLVYAKGFDILIPAFSKLLNEKRGHYELIIGGTGEELASLKQMARDLGMVDKVLFPGSLSPREIVSYLEYAALTIIPSRREPFGISLLEAIAGRAKIVATNVGGMPEIANYGDVLLCEPNEISLFEAMAEAIGRTYIPDQKRMMQLDTIFSRENMIYKYEQALCPDPISQIKMSKEVAPGFQERIRS